MMTAPLTLANNCSEHPTPLGIMHATWNRQGLHALSWQPPTEPIALEPIALEPIGLEPAANAASLPLQLDRCLQRYFDADTSVPDRRELFDEISIDETGWTDFQRRVYQHCRKIPAGETRTYQQLASAAGSPNASRAVGSTMARNRLLLVIPCHRVVGADGSLRGFSAQGGLDSKRFLLNLESQ
ncbi:Methylated-DNA--protein-cysteine methyltransferase [Stieleria bergensis]|uniref:methylated-DNA--[protein]-cysteine S-methyltransferase n=1 Tax=Stieleria bergensis TaxID=2528025 RepID=A0A517SZU3_9BACT|nr:Methylated-DNA--protein-cysteine methyltransferase [Planctomycetes bacterium SV_7m_r]